MNVNVYYCQNRNGWYCAEPVVDEMDDAQLRRWTGLHPAGRPVIACQEARQDAAEANSAREELALRRRRADYERRQANMVWDG